MSDKIKKYNPNIENKKLPCECEERWQTTRWE